MQVEELDKEVLVKIVKAIVAFNASGDSKVQFLQDYIDIVDKNINVDCVILDSDTKRIYEFYNKGVK